MRQLLKATVQKVMSRRSPSHPDIPDSTALQQDGNGNAASYPSDLSQSVPLPVSERGGTVLHSRIASAQLARPPPTTTNRAPANGSRLASERASIHPKSSPEDQKLSVRVLEVGLFMLRCLVSLNTSFRLAMAISSKIVTLEKILVFSIDIHILPWPQ